MSKKVVIELTSDEAETLSDSIGQHIEDMYALYGADLDELQCMEQDKRDLETLNAVRLRILAALEDMTGSKR